MFGVLCDMRGEIKRLEVVIFLGDGDGDGMDGLVGLVSLIRRLDGGDGLLLRSLAPRFLFWRGS